MAGVALADRHRRGPDRGDHRGRGGQGPARPGVRAARARAPAAGPSPAAPSPEVRHDRADVGWFLVGGLLVALLLAGVVSNFASVAARTAWTRATLEGCTVDAEGKITGGTCIAQGAQDHELADSPLADYGIRGLDNAFLSTGLSGVLGVLLTFAIGGGIFWLVRRRGRRARPQATAASSRWAPGTRTRCTSTGVRPVHRLPPEVKIVGDGGCSRSPWWPRRARSSGPSAATRCCSPCVAALARVRRRLAGQAGADRAAVRAARARAAVRSATGERVDLARAVAVGRRPLRRLEHLRQGHAGRARVAAAGRDHHARAT